MRLAYSLEMILAYLLYCTGIYWIWKKRLQRRGARIVLVYHRVLNGRRKTGEMVGEGALERQMKHIKAHFHPVNWQDLIGSDIRPGEIRVFVTFDDGFSDTFTRALPIIEKHGIPCAIFSVTDFIFQNKRIERDEREQGDNGSPPSMEDLQAARQSAYVTYGNHTASHRLMSDLDSEEFEREIVESQRQFKEKLGIEPEIFAYPRGRRRDVPASVFPILERSGFRAAFTMMPGLVGSKTHRYLIPRIGMSHVNDPILFRVKMLGLLSPFIRLRNRLGL